MGKLKEHVCRKITIGVYSIYKIERKDSDIDFGWEECFYIENDETEEGIHLSLHEIKDMMQDNL